VIFFAPRLFLTTGPHTATIVSDGAGPTVTPYLPGAPPPGLLFKRAHLALEPGAQLVAQSRLVDCFRKTDFFAE
jgi:hypothetical protein